VDTTTDRPQRRLLHLHRHSEDGNVDLDGDPRVLGAPHPLSMVYGGGAVFGIAYGAGVAHGLAAAGIPVATAPALGTSAGSWVASAVALGVGYDDLDELEVPPLPNRRRGVLADIARRIFGDATHPLVSVSAVCVRTRRRHILDGGRYPLADLVAASSAVPGLLPPHRIDGRLYIDGGMWSATSVDAAATAEHVIVVAPLAGPVLGPMGRTAGFLLDRELRAWRRRHPGHRITLIRPNREIARHAGRNPMSLFDADRARRVYPLAYEQGLRWGERIASDVAA
jgi:NTE family protein